MGGSNRRAHRRAAILLVGASDVEELRTDAEIGCPGPLGAEAGDPAPVPVVDGGREVGSRIAVDVRVDRAGVQCRGTAGYVEQHIVERHAGTSARGDNPVQTGRDATDFEWKARIGAT